MQVSSVHDKYKNKVKNRRHYKQVYVSNEKFEVDYA